MKKTLYFWSLSIFVYLLFFNLLFGICYADILEEIENKFIEIHEKVGRSVVNIERESQVSSLGVDREELFKQFGLPLPEGEKLPKTPPPKQMQKVMGTGSGFIYSKDGYIVTNNHVVEDADKITVKTVSGKKYPAKVIGTDSEADLAVLKIEPEEELIPVVLGDSDQLKVGQFVAAIGSARGLEGSVSFGHISALGRENLRELQLQGLTFQHLIQTDAGINLGNSGGPLTNIKGEVIGINVALMLGANRIGFAIPINTAKRVIPQLIQSGKVIRGYLGVAVSDAERYYKPLNMPSQRGAFVKRVQPGTPAEKAGIKVYDVILKVNEHEVENAQDLVNTVSSYMPGTEVTLEIWRDEQTVSLPIILGERNLQVTQSIPQKISFLGMNFGDVNKQQQEKQGAEYNGILIESIEEGSPAEDAGLLPGDIIIEIQRKSVSSINDLTSIMSSLISENKPVIVRYVRGKEEPDITVIEVAQ
ncbi:MAG TPA: PDZ domain-containing protein [Candidatus Hydrogenedens sp.]|nr:PDZ domain-containing protein [Candidatus Hydrogenedens sp.]HOL19346.1 PDZ domain-containing protein [Candidatus Hydrogenedens sp.]HPP57946.1 PDZ domain-containing protein [Candidatus Hydrogenedens sp.]